ncbi:alpha/beta fold hydrolase [Amnibacterium sp. CER49]|uniref:alpha/beta fold hydrolase n=1 Tax=Amnibacterium sp. CER49 TaxID=3039161 RepID=UPI00244D7C97|nr:alpha/beta fold hydrolase [Amnibacterium sp. CER49]MDH2443372.1 alpha/beta fold hydrolase [Amnibacterium sp. CER49]
MTDDAPRFFAVREFRTESGVVLPEARLAYRTFGSPDAPRGAVLVPSHFMAGSADNEFVIGEGLALDPAEFFVVATELLGNGVSSSPSNTPAPFDGPRFPVTTIRDTVGLIHRLLVEELHVEHLAAVVGFSMGAMQAFQLAVSLPGFADRVVALAGTARCYPHGTARLEGQLAALLADPSFAGGEYTEQPSAGIAAFGTVWAAWLYSQQWWRDELWRETDPEATFESTMREFRDDFLPGADANDVVLHCRTWQRHDVGTTPGADGDTQAALATIGVPVLVMPGETDLYFPVGDAALEAAAIPQGALLPIPSLWGHPAGAGASPADKDFLNDAIRRFLAGGTIPEAAPLPR